jgi:quinol monooxygenase YgiN
MDVPDFDEWRASYQGAEHMRERRGITTKSIYRQSGNENRVTVISNLADLQAAKEFFTNPNWLEAMEKRGLAPDVKILEEA